MPFRDLVIKKVYSSEYDDIVDLYYVPILSESVEYYRMAGFFSSSSLAISARGLINLIKNGGKMKLITSPKLSPEDYNTIARTGNLDFKELEEKMIKQIDEIKNEFERDHIFALGWMLTNDKLEIKLAIPKRNSRYFEDSEGYSRMGLFHQKIGIFKDENGDYTSFSGSVNESFSGWAGENIEEFKSFKSWIPDQHEFMKPDLEKFEKYWNNQMLPEIEVINIFEGVKKKLIDVAPEKIEDINLEKWYKSKNKKIQLFKYQIEAIEKWRENGHKGIFEMATGTGKTFTALGCLKQICKTPEPLLTVITCPQRHLINQWANELKKFDFHFDKIIIAPSTRKWKDALTDSCIDLELGNIKSVLVITTHRTFSSDDFKAILKSNIDSTKLFLIADEVHGIGAEKSRSGLIQDYYYRIGLSATPKRFFDDAGTEVIYSFFGGVVFEFSLEKAINTINPATGDTFLTPYRYKPIFVNLSISEMEQYIDITRRISYYFQKEKTKDLKDENLTRLLTKRANIIKNCENKMNALVDLLISIDKSQKWTIIYCSPQQIDDVMRITSQYFSNIHRFTMEEGTIPKNEYSGLTEREFILNKFANGKYQVLIAMKCLDEGVDVPPARVAVLIASSSNNREYIQRIGRIIRRCPGKKEAQIYDMIVVPDLNVFDPELIKTEGKILEKEYMRSTYIAANALNGAEALKELYDKMKI